MIAPKVFGSAPFQLKAKAASKKSVAYESKNPEIASVSGDMVTIHRAGVARIVAGQPGDAVWAPAEKKERLLVILPRQQRVSLSTLKNSLAAGMNFTLTPQSNSDLPITMSSKPPGIVSIEKMPDGSFLAKALKPGRAVITATQEGDENNLAAIPVSRTVTVKDGTPVSAPTPTPTPEPTPEATPTPAPTPTPNPYPEPAADELPPAGMVNVRGGTFAAEKSVFFGETVQPFFIAKYEVTWERWKEVRDYAKARGYDLAVRSSEGTGEFPADSMTWHEAVKWCNALSEKEGLITAYRVNGEIYRTGKKHPDINPYANGYRLPTEREWEWAARGGASGNNYTYSGNNNAGSVAWHAGNSGRAAHAVGTKDPNELGIHDMSGNVQEMCWDRPSASGFAVRGGYYGDNPDTLSINTAVGTVDEKVSAAGAGLGFRVVRSYGLPSIDQMQYPVKEEYLEMKVDEFLGATDWRAKKIIPVVILNYLSSADGTRVIADQELSAGLPRQDFLISELNKYYLLQSLKIKASLNEATKFRGFVDPAAVPYASYKVIRSVNLYSIDKVEVPANPQVASEGWRPDYQKIFAKINLKNTVENLGAKDVWFFHRWLSMEESNMSSPTTGDVSNSAKDESDLPVYSKTYVVYNAPCYSPWQNLLHCMGHQFEAQLAAVDAEFFWVEFVGGLKDGFKCGCTHFPPNGRYDYDYNNSSAVYSVLADWSPDPGRNTIPVTSSFWARPRPFQANLPSFTQILGWDWASTAPFVGEDGQGGWMITWFQSLPSSTTINFKRENVATDRISAGPIQFVQVQGGVLPDGSGLAGASVGSFQIGKYEVTLGQWKEVRNWSKFNGYRFENDGSGQASDYPTAIISWYDAVKWCNAKSEKDGFTPVYYVDGKVYRSGSFGSTGSDAVVCNTAANGYRLPTETEWEWAARGGVNGAGYIYSGSNDVNSVAWYSGNSAQGARPIGGKLPNELGLYDMSGNVSEYCWDRSGNYRRVRGGDWNNAEGNCAVGSRANGDPPGWSFSVGFRLARNAGVAAPPVAPRGPYVLENWWDILYDWDQIGSRGLYRPVNTIR